MDGLSLALEAISKRVGDLFVVDLNGLEVVFHLPPIKSAQQYAMLLSLCETQAEINTVYEAIFKSVVEDEWFLTSSASGQIPAGIPATIANLVLMLSGYSGDSRQYTEELIKTYRRQAKQDNVSYMQSIICTAFSAYTFEMLEEVNYQKLVNLFIQAEKLLIERGIIEGEHSFNDPKENKPKPYLVEDVIRQDTQAYNEYNLPKSEDPRVMAKTREMREKAIQRAKEQEAAFKRKMMRR